MKFWMLSLGCLFLVPVLIFVWRAMVAIPKATIFQGSRFVILDYDQTSTTLTNFDFVTRSGFKISFPNELMIDTAGGRGERKLGDVIVAKDQVWAKKSILWSLGVPITLVVREMTSVQRLWWWWHNRSLAIRYIDAAQSSALGWRVDPDGHKVLVLTADYEQLASGWFASRNLITDTVTLQLINTTSIQGLASRYASIANISGIKTGLILSSDEELKNCVLSGSKSVFKSQTFEYLQNLFQCQIEHDEKLASDLLFKLGTIQAE